jgi:hypothetical protein
MAPATAVTARATTTLSTSSRLQFVQQQAQKTELRRRQRLQQQSSLAVQNAVPAALAGRKTATKQATIATALNSAINPMSSSSASTSSQFSHVHSSLSWQQVQSLFLAAAVPMCGFGFMDQFIMVSAGSYIDQTLGVQLGLATMTAAACGQVLSDSCGVLFGGTLERLFVVAPAKLSTAQQALPVVGRIKLLGAVLGVITGCMIGAIPLILTSSREVEEDDKKHHHQHVSTGYEQHQRIRSFLHNVMTSPSERWHRHSARCTLHVLGVDNVDGKLSTRCELTPFAAEVVIVSPCPMGSKSSYTNPSEVQQCINSGDTDTALVSEGKIYVPVMKNTKNEATNPSTRTTSEVTAVLQIEYSNFNFSQQADIDDAKQLARNIGYFL